MKYNLLAILIFLFPTSVLSQTNEFYNFPTIKYDEKYLSNQLERFRRHLDSVTDGLDAKALITLYEKKVATGDTIIYKKRGHYIHSPYVFPKLLKKDSIKLSPPKYSFNDIFQKDYNKEPFIEIEYPLNNRLLLAKYRNDYLLSLGTRDQIYALLNYVQALNASYPKVGGEFFSQSYTLQKHVTQINWLLQKLPADTNKVKVILSFGDVLQSINQRLNAIALLNLYTEAESILLMPYWDMLEVNSKLQKPKDQNMIYEKYLFSHSYSKWLAEVYERLIYITSKVLDGDINNELESLLNKKKNYQNTLLFLYDILARRETKYKEHGNNLKDQITFEYSLKKVEASTKYTDKIYADKIYALNNHLYQILSDSARKEISKLRLLGLYFSLAHQFGTLKDATYEVKAYLMVLKILLTNNLIVDSEAQELYYYSITGALKYQRNEIPFFDAKLHNEINDFYKLYHLTNQLEKLQANNHSPIYHTLYFLNEARFRELQGFTSDAKWLVFEYKNKILCDTTQLINDFFIQAAGLVYKEIYENKWSLNKVSNNNLEKIIDSIAIQNYPFTNKLRTALNGSDNIVQEFANIERNEARIKWSYYTIGLNKQLAEKRAEILKLTEDALILKTSVSELNDELTTSYRVLHDQKKSKDSLLALSNKLSIILQKKSVSIDSANNVISSLTKTKNRLTNLISSLKYSIGGLFILAIVIISFVWWGKEKIVRQKSAELRIINEKVELQSIEEKRLKNENIENNFRHKLEMSVKQSHLLSLLAINHDVDKFIPRLPESISKVTSESKDYLVKVADDFAEYNKLVKNTGGQLTNTVKDEIEIVKKSTPVFLFLSNSTVKYKILEDFSHPDEILQLQVPKNMITSLVANSIKHGKAGKNEITVWIRCQKIENGYSFSIEDNGSGFESLGLEYKSKEEGLNLLLEQVINFNEQNTTGYKVEYQTANVQNKTDKQGVIVSFQIIRNA